MEYYKHILWNSPNQMQSILVMHGTKDTKEGGSLFGIDPSKMMERLECQQASISEFTRVNGMPKWG